MIEVAAAIIFSGEHFLIARRGPQKDQSGYWEFPGGKREENEEIESCLEREIREELSLHIKVNKHLTDNIFSYTNKTICLRGYICELLSGNVRLTDHDRVEWILSEDLDKYTFAPADVAIAESLKSYLTKENK